jgi:glutamate carboxypeptidase
MIEALKCLEASNHTGSIDWTLYVNPDEELGSPGSAEVLADLAREHDIGLVYEPSLADGSLAYKRMGTGNFTVLARGKAAHVGRDFKSGRNALVAASDLALELNKLNKDNNIILNIGNIICEGPLNVVPDLSILRFNVRVADAKAEESVSKKINNLINKIAKKHKVDINLSGNFNRKAKVPDARLEKLYKSLQECAREMGLDIKLRNTGGCCDGNNLWEHGLANIDTLGVRGGSIHSDAEYVLLDSIEERIELSYRFLVKLAGIK